MKTKFYIFNQNNSGGRFDVDENVCHRVVIEANNEDHAKQLFEPMIADQSSSCPCCGDRWYIESPNEVELDRWKNEGYGVAVYSIYKEAEDRWFKLYGKYNILKQPVWENKYSRLFIGSIYFDSIEQYCQYLADEYEWTTPDIRIHYLDGTKKEILTANK